MKEGPSFVFLLSFSGVEACVLKFGCCNVFPDNGICWLMIVVFTTR